MIYTNNTIGNYGTITLKPGEWWYDAPYYISITDPCDEVTWRSSDDTIASVGYSDGYINAISNGTVTICAVSTCSKEVIASFTVRVSDAVEVESITLSANSLTLEKDTYEQLYATVCPSNASNKEVYWTTGDGSVATVSSEGTVCAKGVGETYIVATAAGGNEVSTSCSIKVTENPLAQAIKFEQNIMYMYVSEEKKNRYEVRPTDANQAVTWSSGNIRVAKVDANGKVKATGLGSTHIHATANDGSYCTGSFCVVVAPINSITISACDQPIEVGKSVELDCTISPSTVPHTAFTWSSDNECVASVCCSDSGVVVNAISPGDAAITAVAVDGSGVFGTTLITVEPPIYVDSITLNRDSVSMYKGFEIQLSAEVLPCDAANKNVEWISENPFIATVSENGFVTAQAAGSTNIIARAKDGSEKYGSCAIEVLAAQVTVDPKTEVLKPGEMTNLYAEIFPSQITDLVEIKWRSSNPRVASVDETGFVTAKKEGTAIITATEESGRNSDSCTIIVDSREKVTVEKDQHSFCVKFADEKVWKNIGIDLSNRQENYNNMYQPNMSYNNYEFLIEEEQRFLDNNENFYSEKQLALLYLLDPFGIEYYLTQYGTIQYERQFQESFNNYNDKVRAYLNFKDRIYKEIFGRSPTPFVLSDDGTRVDITSSYDRINVFTDSELIFGAHNIENVKDLIERAVDIIIYLVDSALPDTTKNQWIMRGVNVAKTLLFSGSIVEAFSEFASDFLSDYIEDSSGGKITIMEWPNPLLDSIYNFKEGIDEILTLPNIHDIKICDKVNKQNNYIVEFSNGSAEMFLVEIIELCS